MSKQSFDWLLLPLTSIRKCRFYPLAVTSAQKTVGGALDHLVHRQWIQSFSKGNILARLFSFYKEWGDFIDC
ncbi:hypothetical protein D3878_17425 [Noviherbaspirillum sedimenti]|uniref:Uncharacterized protein n=1 Tax=Noviherbaspirillum sedimenti TaxID=2320865 RepID=A0A3A3G3T6_9BURK|nr:hypothetical protein D3878_17425 [Noviherbaspirillum sedimenti]